MSLLNLNLMMVPSTHPTTVSSLLDTSTATPTCMNRNLPNLAMLANELVSTVGKGLATKVDLPTHHPLLPLLT